MSYIGRFAPSATGDLHLGSLATCIACALEAYLQQGAWFVRIDDLDTERCSPTWSKNIENTILQYCALNPPQRIYRQSDNLHRYISAFKKLSQQGQVYRCSCSRRDIQDWSDDKPHTCREDLVASPIQAMQNNSARKYSYRLKSVVEDNATEQPVPHAQDIVIFRRDQCFSYHFSCVVDDYHDQVTHIIRGEDLIEAQQHQQRLIKALNYSMPAYAYIPLIYNMYGGKLSKQNKAKAIAPQPCVKTLHAALLHFNWSEQALACKPESEETLATHHDQFAELWHWAITHWDLAANSRQL